jgi:hypothetical protein
VQEDKAPTHASRYQQEVFDIWEIQRLLWLANSPDLNAIEPTWFWMKRETSKKGPSTNKEQLRKDWVKCWNDMPQEKIQAWIERIPVHIKEIIACDGNSLYQEGRKKGEEKLLRLIIVARNSSNAPANAPASALANAVIVDPLCKTDEL